MKNRLKKYIAECVGTLVLVVVGCGVAIGTGANVVATALAFGIAIVILAYSIGKISGGHVNPAVSLGVFINGGMDAIDLLGYICSQIVGALAGSALLGLFFGGYNATGANGPIGFFGNNAINLVVSVVIELVLTFFFVLAILGITSKKEDSSLGGLLIGAVLTGIHLLGIPLTGTSVNPARSLSAAVFSAFGGNLEPLKVVWIFFVGPLLGAALAALLWRFYLNKKEPEIEHPAPEK